MDRLARHDCIFIAEHGTIKHVAAIYRLVLVPMRLHMGNSEPRNKLRSKVTVHDVHIGLPHLHRGFAVVDAVGADATKASERVAFEGLYLFTAGCSSRLWLDAKLFRVDDFVFQLNRKLLRLLAREQRHDDEAKGNQVLRCANPSFVAADGCKEALLSRAHALCGSLVFVELRDFFVFFSMIAVFGVFLVELPRAFLLRGSIHAVQSVSAVSGHF